MLPEDLIKKRAKKVVDAGMNIQLANLSEQIETNDKLSELLSKEVIIPEFPTEISVSNLPETQKVEITNPVEIQKVEITNLPEEKDNKEELKLLKEIASELKKKEQYAYDIEIDSTLKEQLKGDKGEKGDTGQKGDQGSPDTPEQVRDKLSSLNDDARLDAKYIKNLPKATSGSLGIKEIIAGTGVTVDNSNLLYPVVSATGGAGNIQTLGRNSTGSTLYKGMIVYMSGSTGNRPNFSLSKADAESTSSRTFGVVVDDISNNSDGYVLNIGELDTLDTRTTATHPFTSDTLADGDTVYLSPTTAGYITNVKPVAPNHIVYIGKVVRTHPTQGYIVYQIQNGYELDEIHDVLISSPTNGQVLTYDSATELWKNETPSNITSFETVSKNLNASGATLNYTGDQLVSIDYANGITKTFNYTGDNLTSVVLSGSTPSGIDLTKTLSYTGDNLTGVAYS